MEYEMNVEESKSEKPDTDLPEFRLGANYHLKLLKRCRVLVESVTVCIIIGAAWALLSLPTLFYFLPQLPPPAPVKGNATSTGCANYTKSACLQALMVQSNECFFDGQNNSNAVMIAANVDQEASESTAQLVVDGLPLLGATEACTSSFVPFMCLYLFPLCDGNGTVTRPSRDQCIEISTVVCKDEWQKALGLQAVKKNLPDCASLPTTSNCEGVDEPMPQNITSVPSSTNISCSDSFFFNNGSCHPDCGKWKQYPQAMSHSVDAIVVISASVGLITGIVLLVCSIIKRQTMFEFPSVIIAYMAITTNVLAVFILLSLANRETLLCSSKDLAEAVKTPTAFCSFIGSVYYYSLLQLAFWWISHVLVLFWKVKFPFHAKTFEYIKCAHVTVVVLALLLPAIPVISALATGGFTIGYFPPLLCVMRRGDVAYYTVILPISLIVAIGTTLLILILAAIIKHGISLEKNAINKKTMKTAERKIFIILCYYIVLASVALASFSIYSSSGSMFIEEVVKYFICEAGGSGKTCDSERKRYESFFNPGPSMVTFLLLGALPVVNLTYMLNLNGLSCAKLCSKRTSVQLSISADDGSATE